jgi:hypothetical protein
MVITLLAFLPECQWILQEEPDGPQEICDGEILQWFHCGPCRLWGETYLGHSMTEDCRSKWSWNTAACCIIQNRSSEVHKWDIEFCNSPISPPNFMWKYVIAFCGEGLSFNQISKRSVIQKKFKMTNLVYKFLSLAFQVCLNSASTCFSSFISLQYHFIQSLVKLYCSIWNAPQLACALSPACLCYCFFIFRTPLHLTNSYSPVKAKCKCHFSRTPSPFQEFAPFFFFLK